MACGTTYNDENIASETSYQPTRVSSHFVALTKTHYIYLFLKRFFDIALSILALVFLSPLFLLTAIAIKLEDGGPIIYSQLRVGKNGKFWLIVKSN